MILGVMKIVVAVVVVVVALEMTTTGYSRCIPAMIHLLLLL